MSIRSSGSITVFAVIVAISLGACSKSDEPKRAAHSVDDYLAQPDLMKEKIRECSDNPGDLRNDPDCVNVKEAVRRQGLGSLKSLPPLNFKPPPGTPANLKNGGPPAEERR